MKKLVYKPRQTRRTSPRFEERFNATELCAEYRDGTLTIAGYAATYNTLSHDIPAGNGEKFRERIKPGAFDKVLRTNPDVLLLLNHDEDKVLGRTTAGTLRLSADAKGLRFEADLPDSPTGQDVYAAVERGELECSFAFDVDDEGMCEYAVENVEQDTKNFVAKVKSFIKQVVRTITGFSHLYDASVVSRGAYPNTSVDARNVLVTAEVRSRVAAAVKSKFPTTDEIRARVIADLTAGVPSFEDRIEAARWYQDVKRRRDDILNFLM